MDEHKIIVLDTDNLIADAKAPCGTHQASDESVHGVVPAGEEEDHRELPRLAQRGDLEEPGEEVEGADGGGEEAVRGGGGKAEDAPPQGVPPVQVSAKEEAQDDENSGREGGEEGGAIKDPSGAANSKHGGVESSL